MARSFSVTTTDWIKLGNPTALNPSFPMTVAAIVRVATFTALTSKVLSRGLSTGLVGWSFGFQNTGKLLFTKYGVADIPTVTLTISGGAHTLIGAVVTSTAVRFFAQPAPAYTISFENVANNQAFKVGTPNDCLLGAELINNGVPQRVVDGEIEVAGVWKTQATDAQISNLIFGGLPAWHEIPSMVAFLQLDQATTAQAVVDEAGNANQSAISGTTVPMSAYPEWTTPGVDGAVS